MNPFSVKIDSGSNCNEDKRVKFDEDPKAMDVGNVVLSDDDDDDDGVRITIRPNIFEDVREKVLSEVVTNMNDMRINEDNIDQAPSQEILNQNMDQSFNMNQDLSPSYRVEDSNQNFQIQDPNQNFEIQDPNQNFEVQDPNQNFDIQDPNRTIQIQDPSRNFQIQDPSRNFKIEDPSRNFQIQDPSRNFQIHNSSRNFQIQESGNQNYQVQDSSQNYHIHDSSRNYQIQDSRQSFQILDSRQSFQTQDSRQSFRFQDSQQSYQIQDLRQRYQIQDSRQNYQVQNMEQRNYLLNQSFDERRLPPVQCQAARPGGSRSLIVPKPKLPVPTAPWQYLCYVSDGRQSNAIPVFSGYKPQRLDPSKYTLDHIGASRRMSWSLHGFRGKSWKRGVKDGPIQLYPYPRYQVVKKVNRS